tara:strand:- start:156 stop:986 length:831 start_codon:yes stop_codon:yes gene_type:complete
VNKASSENFKRNDFAESSGEEWVQALNRIDSKMGVPVSLLGGEPALHKDFIYIINNIKPELNIDILTNLWWSDKEMSKFIGEVSPERVNRDALYPSIRVSYHPGEMGEGEKLIDNAMRLKEAGFNIGMEGVMYPSADQLESLERMAIRCKGKGLGFRVKSFIGVYDGKDDTGRPFSMTYGNYSKYPGAMDGKKGLEKMCKTSIFLINPNLDIYRCQRDLLLSENSTGNLADPSFKLQDVYRPCNNYGECHPCDVKVKTNNRQQLGNTDVEIKDMSA